MVFDRDLGSSDFGDNLDLPVGILKDILRSCKADFKKSDLKETLRTKVEAVYGQRLHESNVFPTEYLENDFDPSSYNKSELRMVLTMHGIPYDHDPKLEKLKQIFKNNVAHMRSQRQPPAPAPAPRHDAAFDDLVSQFGGANVRDQGQTSQMRQQEQYRHNTQVNPMFNLPQQQSYDNARPASFIVTPQQQPYNNGHAATGPYPTPQQPTYGNANANANANDNSRPFINTRQQYDTPMKHANDHPTFGQPSLRRTNQGPFTNAPQHPDAGAGDYARDPPRFETSMPHSNYPPQNSAGFASDQQAPFARYAERGSFRAQPDARNDAEAISQPYMRYRDGTFSYAPDVPPQHDTYRREQPVPNNAFHDAHEFQTPSGRDTLGPHRNDGNTPYNGSAELFYAQGQRAPATGNHNVNFAGRNPTGVTSVPDKERMAHQIEAAAVQAIQQTRGEGGTSGVEQLIANLKHIGQQPQYESRFQGRQQ